MKKIFFAAIFLAIATMSFAQTQTTIFSAKLKKEKVPVVIIESIEEDFPDFTITEYYGVPMDVVDDVWFIDEDRNAEDEDFDTYSVLLKGKKSYINATYDKEGNLLSSREKLTDALLPYTIRVAVGTHFPGWAVIGDKIIMTTHKGHVKKAHYKVKLKKDNKEFYALFDASGNLLKGKQHSVHHKMLARKKNQK